MNDIDVERILRNQVAIINLVGALAEKLTGKKPIISIEQRDGSLLRIEPTTLFIAWNQEGEGFPCPNPSEKPKEFVPCGEHHA